MSGIAEVASRILEIQGRFDQMSTRFSAGVGTTGFAGALSAARGEGSVDGAGKTVRGSGSGGGAGGADTADRVGNALSPTGPTGTDVVADAKKYLGIPYVFGGNDPAKGLDCSSLVQHVFKDLGVDLPRLVRDQRNQGQAVASLADAKPGDLLIFDGHEHIGIYLGGNKMLHAPQQGENVKVGNVYETPTSIRRILPAEQIQNSAVDASNTLLRASALGHSRHAHSAHGHSKPLPSASGTSTWGLSPLASSLLADSGSVDDLDSIGGSSADADNADSTLVAALGSAGIAGPQRHRAVGGAGGSSEATLAGVPFGDLFAAAGARRGVSPALLAAVAKVESNYDPDALSPAGARGLMQITPATAHDLGVNPLDPRQAVDGAARLLRQHLNEFGSLPLALAAYNAGGGSVRRYGGIPPFAETQAYVVKVQNALSALGKDAR